MLYVCSSDLACKAHVGLKRLGWCRAAAEDHKAKAKEVEHALQASLRDKEKQLKEAIKEKKAADKRATDADKRAAVAECKDQAMSIHNKKLLKVAS